MENDKKFEVTFTISRKEIKYQLDDITDDILDRITDTHLDEIATDMEESLKDHFDEALGDIIAGRIDNIIDPPRKSISWSNLTKEREPDGQ